MEIWSRVQTMLAPLYTRFDFTRLPGEVVRRELNRLPQERHASITVRRGRVSRIRCDCPSESPARSARTFPLPSPSERNRLDGGRVLRRRTSAAVIVEHASTILWRWQGAGKAFSISGSRPLEGSRDRGIEYSSPSSDVLDRMP
jgi:hypothetical protein